MSLQSERLKQLTSRLEACRHLFSKIDGRRQALESAAAAYALEVEECSQRDLSYKKLQAFFQGMELDEQARLQRWFESVITYGLQAIFGDAYRFIIIGPEVRNNELSLNFKIMKRYADSELEQDPYDEMGGGVADVLSLLLQFIMVFLLRDRVNPILFLDEPCKHLSVAHRPAMASLLKELVDKTAVQIVMVTHDTAFSAVADKIYEFSHDGIKTHVEEVINR